MHLSFRIEATQDLVLRWHVQLLHHTVKFLTEFGIFIVKLGDVSVLLGQQESQILHFIHGLPALCLPFEIGSISMLLRLDQLEMKWVVLLHKALILFLERRHWLWIQTGLLRNDSILVLQCLESFCRLHHLIEQSLHKSSRLNIYSQAKCVSWNVRFS